MEPHPRPGARPLIVDLALAEPDLSPRELAPRFTDRERYFVSEASVHRRLLAAHDLIASPAFVEHYIHRRTHESLDNLAPADVYFGRAEAILQERQRIKRQTIQRRRLLHHRQAA